MISRPEMPLTLALPQPTTLCVVEPMTGGFMARFEVTEGRVQTPGGLVGEG
jgi:hypothetical protein